MGTFARLATAARTLKSKVVVVYFALRDLRTPRMAKIVGGIVVAYALSPIDLIPDFIPVIGLLDDLVLVPAGIWLTVRLIPPHILADAHAKVDRLRQLPRNYLAAALIVLLWIGLVAGLSWWAYRHFFAPTVAG